MLREGPLRTRIGRAEDGGVGTRAAIYARVSTVAGQSPQMQLDVLREYAARRGLVVAAEFVDHGVSGARDPRPELDRLMAGARQRAFGVVLVYRFDRFARGVRHLVTALDEFQALGVEFVSYSESLDTSTPMGRAMFSIVAALAELERNVVVERSVEGQRRARAHGTHVGRPRRQVDEERVRCLRAEGKSVRAVALALGVSRTVVARVERERGRAA
jgi:DNA invertase Pin-like site-specific DNA recombinase